MTKMNRRDPRFILAVLITVFFIALALSIVTVQTYGGGCSRSACALVIDTQTPNHVTTMNYVIVYNNDTAFVYCVQHSPVHQCQSTVNFTIVFHDGRATLVQTQGQACPAPQFNS